MQTIDYKLAEFLVTISFVFIFNFIILVCLWCLLFRFNFISQTRLCVEKNVEYPGPSDIFLFYFYPQTPFTISKLLDASPLSKTTHLCFSFWLFTQQRLQIHFTAQSVIFVSPPFFFFVNFSISTNFSLKTYFNIKFAKHPQHPCTQLIFLSSKFVDIALSQINFLTQRMPASQ